MDPSSSVLHYAFTLSVPRTVYAVFDMSSCWTRFEGMKAHRQEDGTVRLFRPDMNMRRMNRVRDLSYSPCASVQS